MQDSNSDELFFLMKDVEEKDKARDYYIAQLESIKNNILSNPEKYNLKLDKCIVVMKPPVLPSNTNVAKTLKRILTNMHLETCKPKDFTIHDLRRTTSTLLNQIGNDMVDIQNILGHEDQKTTIEHYVETNYVHGYYVLKGLDKL